MPTIIQHRSTGKQYILLGAGYGIWATARPHKVLGDIVPKDDRGEYHLLCVCDEQGDVSWVHPDAIKVISVAGQSPKQVLQSIN